MAEKRDISAFLFAVKTKLRSLTFYRRLILTLDYDGVGLSTGADRNEQSDDALRSLYNALVHHKVVCAGYAYAMQYLLQKVGIVAGYVISERVRDGSCHAFNVLKIGKYCYYLDATWGDLSDTEIQNNSYQSLIRYNYFCVPYEEFLQTSDAQRPNHIP